MNYTKNYKLPQWVETDRIQMEDFNQAMADIDAGLQAIRETADAADSAASEGTEKIGSLETRVTAVENVVKLVKLAGPVTTTADNATIAFDLSKLNMNDYAAIIIVTRGNASNSGPDLYINGTRILNLYSTSVADSASMTWLQPSGSYIVGISSCCTVNNNYGYETAGSIGFAWGSITQMSAAGNSIKGMNCILYGLKV